MPEIGYRPHNVCDKRAASLLRLINWLCTERTGGFMSLKNIETAPKDGASVILECDGRLLQASWHSGKWLEEKEWEGGEKRLAFAALSLLFTLLELL